MASIHSTADGRRRIHFIGADGKRRDIRIGKVKMKTAERVLDKIEAILESQKSGTSLDPEVAVWLNKLGDRLHAKFVAKRLAKPRETANQTTLAAFIDDYLAKRTDLKPRTIINLKQTKRWLVKFFGENKPLALVTEGDADEFRLFLKDHIGENTLRRICGRARQYFRAAMKKRYITSNPFAEMKGITVQSNAERQFFVTAEMAAKVLDACPDTQWRLIFALCRFGGLRCPSEHLALTWNDVDWENSRLTIRSAKTEHHEGKGSRVIPIFPELMEHLDRAWEEVGEKEAFVINKFRDSNTNLRTQFTRILNKAGIQPWPKLFQNLRSSRETELAESFPIHVVCEWIGNSQAIAKKHYLQVTDSHFEKALGKVAQKAAHSAAEMPRSVPSMERASPMQGEAFQDVTTLGDLVYKYPVPPVGLEPTTR